MWCGVVWCGVVWCGVVWCGVVWCGVVWCGEGLTESIDTVSECQETPVDVGSFHHSLASVLRVSSSFGACQVNQNQLPHPVLLLCSCAPHPVCV